LAIQVIFKGDNQDIVISGDSVEQIVAKYEPVAKKLELLTSKHRTTRYRKKHKDEKRGLSIRESIMALKTDGFFKSKRNLDEVKRELAKRGVTRPCSPRLTELVRDGELKRDEKKSDGRTTWVYYTR